MKTLSILTVIVVVLAVSSRAQAANTGYLCDTAIFPSTLVPGYGNSGTAYATVYSGPSCTGSFLFNFYICTTGATNTSCAANIFTDTQFAAIVQGMQHALMNNSKVWAITNPVQVLNQIAFYAAGY